MESTAIDSIKLERGKKISCQEKALYYYVLAISGSLLAYKEIKRLTKCFLRFIMKTLTRIIALLVAVILLVNVAGCYGSFALTKKLYTWNGTVGDKWMNSVVMWVLMWIPVYNACGFIDLVILNTVEFWTGSNPITMNDGDQKIQYATNDGKTYKITMSKNNLNILETAGPDKGKAVTLTYSPENGNWSMNDGKTQSIIANLNNNNLKLMYPNGDSKSVQIPR